MTSYSLSHATQEVGSDDILHETTPHPRKRHPKPKRGVVLYRQRRLVEAGLPSGTLSTADMPCVLIETYVWFLVLCYFNTGERFLILNLRERFSA